VRDFTASVSHEFKTPLAAITGAVELLQDSAERLSDAQRARLLANVAESASRLARLVDRLLLLARADLTQPGAVEAEVAEALRAMAERFGPALVLEGAAAALRVKAPPEALDAALGHLVENAVHHGGPAVRVRLRASAEGHRVHLDVRDDGPGVSPANAARIFEPFFTTARDAGGTGLGLAIAAALARAFGGAVALVPSAGPGAWFRLTLPAARR